MQATENFANTLAIYQEESPSVKNNTFELASIISAPFKTKTDKEVNMAD